VTWRERWRSAWLLAPGLSVYIYIILRSAQHPSLDWGAVRSLRDFLYFFFRLQYASAEGTRSLGASIRQSGFALLQLWREGFYVLLPTGIASFVVLRKDRLVQALALAWAACLLAVTFYLNLSADRLEIMRPYLFPAYLAQGALACLGVMAYLGGPSAPKALGLFLRWACLALPLGALGLNYRDLDLSQYHYAQDNARNLLRSLPKRAVLFTQGDALIFPLWYEQRVRGLRTDVAVMDNAVLPMRWVREDLQRAHPDLRMPVVGQAVGAESVNLIVQALVEMNGALRPLYTTYNKLENSIPDWHLVSEGVVYRLACDGDPGPKDLGKIPLANLEASVIRGLTRRPLDARTRRLIVGDFAIHYNALGVTLEEAGRFEQALLCYRIAARIDPESPEFHFNQGNVLYSMTRVKDAVEAFQIALALDPQFKPALYNLGVVCYQSGQKGQAVVYFQTLLKLEPDRQDIKNILASLGAPGGR
jgi:tetratricopeptide (TPR) repeat protein